MVFSIKTEILGMYVDSRIIFPLASNLDRAAGVATNGEHIYWSDIEEGSETIVRKTSQNNHEVIVTTGIVLTALIDITYCKAFSEITLIHVIYLILQYEIK